MMFDCINCGQSWHSSWCKVWDDTFGDWVYLMPDEFVCLTCRMGDKS